MFHHIAFRALAENPAGKHAIPFFIALIFHDQLHKGAGFWRIFPRRGRFAGTQPHNHRAKAALFAGFHGDILNQAVAFIEQAQFRHALVHRGHTVNGLNRLRQRIRFF